MAHLAMLIIFHVNMTTCQNFNLLHIFLTFLQMKLLNYNLLTPKCLIKPFWSIFQCQNGLLGHLEIKLMSWTWFTR
jgi:hypothetical protein